MELPAIVGEEEWQRSQQTLLAKPAPIAGAIWWRCRRPASRRTPPGTADGAVLSVSWVITMANLVGLV